MGRYRSPHSYSGRSSKSYADSKDQDLYNGHDYKSYRTPHSYSGHSGKSYKDSSYPKPHVDSAPHSYKEHKYESYKTHNGNARDTHGQLHSYSGYSKPHHEDSYSGNEEKYDRTAHSFFGHSHHGPHFYGGYPHYDPHVYRGFSHYGPHSYRGFSHYGPYSYGGYSHRIGHSFEGPDRTPHNHTGTDEEHNHDESRSEHQQSFGLISDVIRKIVGAPLDPVEVTKVTTEMPDGLAATATVTVDILGGDKPDVIEEDMEVVEP